MSQPTSGAKGSGIPQYLISLHAMQPKGNATFFGCHTVFL